jgi:hypothetical protein
VRKAGGERWDLASDVVIDHHKNVYICGGYESKAYFGSDSLLSKGGRDVFIAKYDSLGTLKWLRTLGGKKYDNATDMEVKGNGNILLVGNFQDTCLFGQQTLICTGNMNNFIAEYSPLGNLLNLKSIQTDTKADKLFITLTEADDFYVSGTWYDKLVVEGDTVSAQGTSDMFMAGYAGDFSYKGLMRFGGNERNVLKGVYYFDNALYLNTEFYDSTEINQNYKYSYGSSDILLLKTDTMGNILNSKHIAGFGTDVASSVILDRDTNVYMSGEFESNLYFGNDSLLTSGGKDVFLIKTDKDFNTLWFNQIGSETDEYAKSLSVNTVNAVYVSGSFIDTLTLGGKTIVSEDFTADMYIAKFSGEGVPEGLKQSGGSGFEYGNVLINDRNNYLYIIGNFDRDFAFETDSVSSDSLFAANNEDVFIARFYDCDYARYPEIGNDTVFCGYGVLSVLNPETTNGIFGSFKKYTWNTGQTTRFITVFDSGYYYVSTLDNHKCPVKSDSIYVTIFPKPEPDLGADIVVQPGDTLSLFGGIFSGYMWNNGMTTERIALAYDSLETFMNNYTLTATNAFGCEGNDAIVLIKEGYEGTGDPDKNNFDPQNLNPEENPQDKVIVTTGSNVYPNPNNGQFFVNTSNIKENILEIRMYTVEGKQVWSECNIQESPFEITVESNGSHYLVIETQESLFIEKIIIK